MNKISLGCIFIVDKLNKSKCANLDYTYTPNNSRQIECNNSNNIYCAKYTTLNLNA